MKKQLTIAAAALLAASAPSTAGDNGRTVCVLRARPVAIQPVDRPVISRAQIAASSGDVSHRIPCNPALRVPVTYGQYVQRTHYVSPCMPNGYVGGLANLPTSVVQIPPSFTRAPSYYGYGGHGGNGGHGTPGGNGGHGGHGGHGGNGGNGGHGAPGGHGGGHGGK